MYNWRRSRRKKKKFNVPLFIVQLYVLQKLIYSLFVSAGLAYKPWLKVLLAGLA